MKYLQAIAFLFLGAVSLVAQNTKVQEPEFTGVVLLVNPDDSTAQKLEKQTASAASKADVGAAIFGIAKGKSMNIVGGATSPIRTANGARVKLIVRAQDNSRDPAEVVNVFKIESDNNKNKRVLIVGKVAFNKGSTLDIEFLPFQGSKYGTGSYLIELTNVEPGEYVVTLDGTRSVFNLFGID